MTSSDQGPKDQTVLLTGAFGKVAVMMRPLLLARYGTLILSDRDQNGELAEGETFRKAELGERSAVDAMVEGVDSVIHFGGQSTEAPWDTIMDSNIVGLTNLFEACRLNNVKRMVFASSNHTIGFYTRPSRIGVDHRVRPDTRYGLSKAYGEALGSLYADKFGMRVLNIRIGNVDLKPADRRRLAIWLHPEDLMSLCVIGLEHPDLHCEIVYGASDNERSFWNNDSAHRLGYRPKHKAEDHAAYAFAEEAKLSPDPLGDQFQGGGFCTQEFDGDLDRLT